jgi:2-oxoisovalerate dehydrogenase E2 component (dihydrolipoyl transacylase)
MYNLNKFLGNVGGKVLSPVIMTPQSCIIGISKFFDSLTVIPHNLEIHNDSQAFCKVEGKDLSVIIHKTVNVCISADHRIIDGATVARFSQKLGVYIENPLKLLLI